MSKDPSHTDSERETTDRTTPGRTTGRRDYLKLAGTAAVSVAGASVSAGQAAAATVGGVEFGNIVDMVDDAGCDPTGGASCHEEIMEYADDDTLLEFPEGTYRLDTSGGTRVALDGYDSLGLAGENRNVTFEFTGGTDGYNDIAVTDVGRFVYKDLDWDITANDCAPGFAVRVRDRLYIENLAVSGRQDSDGGFTLQPGVANADGIGIVENFAAPDGCEIGSVERNGVLVPAGRNNGTLRFVGCHLEQFSNNGIYAAASGGPIQVEGGTFRNSEPSQLRFSGEGSYVDGALVELDVSDMPREYAEEIENARGIWWETKNTEPLHSGGEIRNTEVLMHNASPPPFDKTSPNSSAGILIPSGGVSIRDTTVRMDITPRVAIHAQAPLQSDLPEPYRVVMDNVTVTGEANDWAAVQIEERPNSVIRNCEFDIGYRDGIILAECDGSSVRDTTINSLYGGGRPIVLWGTDAEISGVTTNSDNPLPDGSNGDDIYGPSPVNHDGSGGDVKPGPNTLTIRGTGPRTQYTFSVTDNLQKSTANGANFNGNDGIRRGYVGYGVVGSGSDSYSFDGSLQTFEIDGDAEVILNGERVTQDDIDDMPPTVLEVEGTDDRATYTVASTGPSELQTLTANNANRNGNDDVFRTTASGVVGIGRDAYGFDGPLDVLGIDGDANVYVDGQSIADSLRADHVVTVVGTGSRANYDITVDSGLEKSTANFASRNGNDDVSGNSASGVVGIASDSYVYNGDISAFTADGDVTVYVDGESVDQGEVGT